MKFHEWGIEVSVTYKSWDDTSLGHKLRRYATPISNRGGKF
jgi:hypothetical protein